MQSPILANDCLKHSMELGLEEEFWECGDSTKRKWGQNGKQPLFTSGYTGLGISIFLIISESIKAEYQWCFLYWCNTRIEWGSVPVVRLELHQGVISVGSDSPHAPSDIVS